MRPARIVRRAQVEEDLISIWSRVAIDDMSAADRLLDKMEARWRLLATQPRSGRSREDLGPDIRQVVVGNYLVLYRLDDDALVILRVLHGHRNIAADDLPD